MPEEKNSISREKIFNLLQGLNFTKKPSFEDFEKFFREFNLGNLRKVNLKERKNIKKIAGICLGGTNIHRGLMDFQSDQFEFLETEVIKKKLKMTEEEFWNFLFDEKILNAIEKEEKIAICITLACPIEKIKDNFFMIHGSGKYNIRSFAPLFPFKKSNQKNALNISLQKYLNKKIKRNDCEIYFALNDSFAAELAYKKFESQNDLQGILIMGSGANLSLENINFEAGQYLTDKISDIEKEIILNRSEKANIEHIISGRIISDVFLEIVKKLSQKDYEKLKQAKKNDICAAIYETGLSKKENKIFQEKYLLYISEYLVERIARVAADLLLALGKKVNKKVRIFSEGSILLENPKLVDVVNAKIINSSVKLIHKKLDLHASVLGTFYLPYLESGYSK